MLDIRPDGELVRTGLLYRYDLQHGPTALESRWQDLIGVRNFTIRYDEQILAIPIALSCDSPYGYLHGTTSGESGRSFIVLSPPELAYLRGHNIDVELHSGTMQWQVRDWRTTDGRPLPEPVRQGYARPPAPTAVVAPVAAVIPPKAVVARKIALEQALDEGYNPVCPESPTGLQRPKTDSATQVLAYLQCCATGDVDLAINELDLLMDNPYGFFHARWPDYKKELSGELSKALSKVG